MTDTRDSTFDGPALDPSALAELRTFCDPGEDDLVAELVEIFLDDTPKRLDALGTAVGAGDARGIAAEAHAMKSSSGQLGAVVFSALCKELETRGREERLDGIEALFARLLDEMTRVRTALGKVTS